MRDAESMLDQLLSAAPDRIDEGARPRAPRTRRCRSRGRPHRPSGRRGRRCWRRTAGRPGARSRRPGAPRPGRRGDPFRAPRIGPGPRATRHDPAALAAVGRRLAAIDPEPPRHRRPPVPARTRDVRRRGTCRRDVAGRGAEAERDEPAGSSDVATSQTPKETVAAGERTAHDPRQRALAHGTEGLSNATRYVREGRRPARTARLAGAASLAGAGPRRQPASPAPQPSAAAARGPVARTAGGSTRGAAPTSPPRSRHRRIQPPHRPPVSIRSSRPGPRSSPSSARTRQRSRSSSRAVPSPSTGRS